MDGDKKTEKKEKKTREELDCKKSRRDDEEEEEEPPSLKKKNYESENSDVFSNTLNKMKNERSQYSRRGDSSELASCHNSYQSYRTVRK